MAYGYLRAKGSDQKTVGRWWVRSKILYTYCYQSATFCMQPMGRNNSKKSFAVLFKFDTDYVS